MELLSQLDGEGGDEVLISIKSILNVYDPKHTGVLPWTDDVLRSYVFGVEAHPDETIALLNHAVERCLNTEKAADLRPEAAQLRNLLRTAKDRIVDSFSDILQGSRNEGALGEEAHRSIYATALAQRAGVDPNLLSVPEVLEKLSAHYAFESTKLNVALSSDSYNPAKHANDAIDSELLIYLVEPNLHLLTSDRGFNRIRSAAQSTRVHVVPMRQLTESQSAEGIIRNILGEVNP